MITITKYFKRTYTNKTKYDKKILKTLYSD